MFNLKIYNKSNSKLKTFLSKYLNKFMAARHVADPGRMTTSGWNHLETNDQAVLAITYYRLMLLNTSLNKYYDILVDMLALIDKYEVDYDFNYKNFAIDNKQDTLNEFEDDDFFEDNEKFDYSDNGLDYHTFVDRLKFDFLGEGASGEHLVSSSKEDYKIFGEMLNNISMLNPITFLEEHFGNKIPIFVVKDGQLVELSPEEKTKKEIKTKENNQKLNDILYLFIDKLNNIAIYISKLDKFKNNEEEILKLREMVLELLNMNFAKEYEKID